MWIASFTLLKNCEDHYQFPFFTPKILVSFVVGALGKGRAGLGTAHLAPVVQKVDGAIHRRNHYPADKYKENQLHYLLERYQSSG